MTSASSVERIRQLNDQFRATGPSAGSWMITPGVKAEGLEFTILAIREVQDFTRFTAGNDPFAEHDFGSFNLTGQTLFWKIDYYDPTLKAGSEDPADPSRTRRVLTLMLASEY